MAVQSEYPTEWEADVLLRNGRPIHLRPITPLDAENLRSFHGTLSSRTVYFRFFSAKPELSEKDVHYFTEVDYCNRVALIAVDADGILGVGRFDAIGEGRAEVAFVIRDEMQGLGLGSVLLEHLAAAARERGITRFVAEVLPENSRMIATFREAGYEVRQRREEDVLAVSFDIEPTDASVAVMSAREHRAEARSVHRLLHPARVAVVGASRNPGGLGHAVLRNISDGGYLGDLVAVHPEVEQIAGVRCVRSLSDVDGIIDLAVVVVPAERVSDVINDAAAAGVHGLVVVSGGFGDTGGNGPDLQADLVGLVHRTGMRLVGPNALGLINTDESVRLNASLVSEMPPMGRIGFFSQSGALGGSVLDRLRRRGLGLSTFMSAGNRADISGNDLLQFWEEDPRTDLVMLYLETIGNARKFARIVHRLALKKPVVMVKAGGAGQRHPLGHAVDSTLLSQRAVDEILGDCGLIVVDTIHQMLDVARIAGSQPLPSGNGLAVIGNSDALAVMAVNGVARTVLTLAHEPVTFARQESPEAYEQAIRTAQEDPAVGVILAIYVPPIEHHSDAEIRATLRRCAIHGASDGPAKPVIAVMLGEPYPESSGDVPVFQDLEDVLQALGAVARHAQWRRANVAMSAAGEDSAADGGISVPVRTEALAPGRLAGPPAVAVLQECGIDVSSSDPGSGAGLGMRVRLLNDPLFGTVVVVGVDDTVAEMLDDRGYRLAPVPREAAAAMLGDVAALAAFTRAFPDTSSVALTALAECISRVSRVGEHRPEIIGIDLREVRWAEGVLTSEDITISVADEPAANEPTARRM